MVDIKLAFKILLFIGILLPKIFLATMACSTGGGTSTNSCSENNSSTISYYAFTISPATINGCTPPTASSPQGGGPYVVMNSVSTSTWSTNVKMNDAKKFCIDYTVYQNDLNHMANNVVFQSKRGDAENTFNIDARLTGSGCKQYRYVGTSITVSVWGGANTVSGFLPFGDMLII